MVLNTQLLTKLKSDLQTDMEALFSFGAVGDGTAIITANSTIIPGETFRSTVDSFDKSDSNKIVASVLIGLTENNGNTIKATGWFSAISGGTMYSGNNLTTTISKTEDIRVYLDTEVSITVKED